LLKKQENLPKTDYRQTRRLRQPRNHKMNLLKWSCILVFTLAAGSMANYEWKGAGVCKFDENDGHLLTGYVLKRDLTPAGFMFYLEFTINTCADLCDNTEGCMSFTYSVDDVMNVQDCYVYNALPIETEPLLGTPSCYKKKSNESIETKNNAQGIETIKIRMEKIKLCSPTQEMAILDSDVN